MRRRATSLGTAALTAVLVASSLSAPADAAPERVVPVDITASNAAFSPNGDGSKDVGTVTYRLAKPGRVTATVSKGGKRVLTRQLGRQGVGTKVFRWNGTRAGKVVADGRYTVTIASRGSRARTPLVVDARYSSKPIDGGRLSTSTGVVYPRTTVIKDVVVGTFVTEAGYRELDPRVTRLGSARTEVLDRRGRVVRSAPVTTFGIGLTGNALDCGNDEPLCARLTWDGRDGKGSIVPAGRYRMRLVARDAAGNPVVVTARPAPIVVSDTRLVRRTTTTALTPQTAQRTLYYYDPQPIADRTYGCNDPAESSRFPGGMTFRDETVASSTGEPGLCPDQVGFIGALPERRTPYDTFALTVTGGPATPGGSGAVLFRAGSASIRMSGDTTVESGPQRMRPNTEAPLSGDLPAVKWTFESTGEQAYDVASFAYTLTQYVPAS